MAQLTALHEIPLDSAKILRIQREELLPILQQPARLNSYAEQIVQAQAVLLDGIHPHIMQQLTQVIEQLIGLLYQSKKILQPRRFNRLQRWFGHDLNHAAQHIHYYQQLDVVLERADDLAQKLQLEIQKSQARYQQVTGWREQMAHAVAAAQQFLEEYPRFVQHQHPLDVFPERLSKKINSLITLQTSNDIALSQMYLNEQLAFSLLDRFKEAQQVLIPAWQYQVQHSQRADADYSVQQLEVSRERLIKMLKRSLKKSSPS